MARFIPDYETILKDDMEKHTPGELHLLSLLRQLDDRYEIYFQAHINMSHPDIVIIKPNGGVLIIEVKDWALHSYSISISSNEDKYGTLHVKGTNAPILSPFQQVVGYKDELFGLLSSFLFLRNTRNKKTYGTIIPFVYFYGATGQDVKRLFEPTGLLNTNGNPKTYARWVKYWCRDDDSIIISQIERLLSGNSEFDEEMLVEMRSLFAPSDSWNEQMKPFILSGKQQLLAECHPGTKTRMSGVAGSGKTLVIAQKAINCWKKKHKPILILTYNITLVNYIRDKIAQNTRELSQYQRSNVFEIQHFQGFLTNCMRLYNIKINGPESYRDSEKKINWEAYQNDCISLLYLVNRNIKHYKTILIDEAQDYKLHWFEFLRDLFMDSDTETLIAADEKQNIYKNEMDNDKKPKTVGFGNGWSHLEMSWRMTSTNCSLALNFQNAFMKEYRPDQFPQISLYETLSIYRYYDITNIRNKEASAYRIIEDIRHISDGISPNDICILSSQIKPLRTLESYIQTFKGPKSTTSICESEEEYQLLRESRGLNEPGLSENEYMQRKNLLHDDLEKIRNIKKYAFNMNTGTIKLCTIHSFKGWEINTIIIILNANDTPEILYTALTRSKQNIIIVNYGNSTYNNWCKQNLVVS